MLHKWGFPSSLPDKIKSPLGLGTLLQDIFYDNDPKKRLLTDPEITSASENLLSEILKSIMRIQLSRV